MRFRVRYSPVAVDDLDALRAWIDSETDFDTAARYLERVRARIATLENFPNRGQMRDDLRPGVRTLSFEGRLLILYSASVESVDILRVVSTARDLRVLWDN